MFCKWNVQTCNRKFPSIIVSTLCRTNIRYSDEYKKHQRQLPAYLKNGPKNIIDHLLMEKEAADHAMMRSVKPINRTCYSGKSSDLTELKKKEYVVDFGNEQLYCSCTCPDFKNNRMICKHFFAATEENHRTFNDISQLFRDHVWINLDSKLFTSSILTKTNLKSSNNTESQTNTMLNQEKDLFDECKEMSNSPPKRVHNETLNTHQNNVRSIKIDLWATLKELHDLTRTMKVSLQQQQ